MGSSWFWLVGGVLFLFFRLQEHKNKKYPDSFTSKYNCTKLVYYENFTTIDEAISREKQLKNWHRQWKENLIMSVNPTWKDLSDLIEH